MCTLQSDSYSGPLRALFSFFLIFAATCRGLSEAAVASHGSPYPYQNNTECVFFSLPLKRLTAGPSTHWWQETKGSTSETSRSWRHLENNCSACAWKSGGLCGPSLSSFFDSSTITYQSGYTEWAVNNDVDQDIPHHQVAMTNSLITSVASFTCCTWFAFNCIHTVDAANIVQRILSVFHFSQIWRAFIIGWLHHVPFLHLHRQVDIWWDTMGLCQENRSMDSCALQSLHSCLQWLIWSCINVMSEQNVLGQAQSLDVRSYFLREMRKACKAVFSFEVPDQWCWISTATVPAWGAGVAATFNGIVHVGRLNNCLIREVKDTRYRSVWCFLQVVSSKTGQAWRQTAIDGWDSSAGRLTGSNAVKVSNRSLDEELGWWESERSLFVMPNYFQENCSDLFTSLSGCQIPLNIHRK